MFFIAESYCVCGKGEFGKMICCDNENCRIGWWHFGCAKLKKEPSGDLWFCDECS